jgi:hypothetical protein
VTELGRNFLLIGSDLNGDTDVSPIDLKAFDHPK